MATISNDFVGVAYARNAAGELFKLRAGDTVPAGVEVRGDLLATPTPPKGGKRGKSAPKATGSNR